MHILILIAGFWPHQALTASVQEPLPPPADPNDAPFMDPPYGQRKPTPSPTILPLNSLHHDKRRFQLTLAPLYASFRLPLLGRPENQFIHGAGAGIEADLRMWKWAWFRVYGSHTVHPMTEVRVLDEEQGTIHTLANAGNLHATNGGFSLVLALDLGRFLPLLEGGAGVLRISMPKGAQDGQQGMPCLENNICDSGLQCSAAGTCEPGFTAELHFGFAIDVLVFRNFSFGGQFRYYALPMSPTKFPIYLIAGLRAGFRF